MIDLQTHWTETCHGLGLPQPPNGLFEALCARYSEPHRHYHSLQHLGECLALCSRDSALAEHPYEVAIALWFHDAIYDVRRHDNESASAAWACTALLAAGAAPMVADRVHDLIMATKHGDLPASIDAKLLVDIDLAILGANPERFEEYEQQIRKEYQHVPAVIFKLKRQAVLNAFLARPSIYATPEYFGRYESAARHNLGSASRFS